MLVSLARYGTGTCLLSRSLVVLRELRARVNLCGMALVVEGFTLAPDPDEQT